MLWWIGCVNGFAPATPQAGHHVSILVVVDWLRQPTSRIPRCSAWRCFNPCCGGLAASTSPSNAAPARKSRFQFLLWWIGCVNRGESDLAGPGDQVSILVVVDWLRQPSQRALNPEIRTGFQSLLWWIGCVNCAGETDGIRAESGFNPCCGGLAASTGLGRRADRAGLRFQSLLWWIGCVNMVWAVELTELDSGFNPCCGGLAASTPSRRPCSSRSSSGFNPCCGGLAASTNWGYAGNAGVLNFQSLLWWIGCVNLPSLKVGAVQSGFQSLLWWIGCVNNHARSFADTDHGFQSLLWWIGCVNLLGRLGLDAQRLVSILVVVDWLRQRPRSPVASPSPFSFNPCCGGLAASTGRVDRHIARPGDVSILVVVDWLRQRVPRTGGRLLAGVSILVVVDWLRQHEASLRGVAGAVVSILVVVDWLRQPAADNRKSIAMLMFQSLLWWIGCVNRK